MGKLPLSTAGIKPELQAVAVTTPRMVLVGLAEEDPLSGVMRAGAQNERVPCCFSGGRAAKRLHLYDTAVAGLTHGAGEAVCFYRSAGCGARRSNGFNSSNPLAVALATACSSVR